MIRYTKYEDHLTYPMVIGHHIREVEGRVINSWLEQSDVVTLTRRQYDDIIDRLEALERKVNPGQRWQGGPV